MTSNPATGVDLDALVEQMLKKGTEHVSRPPRLPEYDFEQIREIVKDVLVGYRGLDLSDILTVPWQMGGGEDGASMMDYIKDREYERALYSHVVGEMIL